MTASVAFLCRHPVKSLGEERLEEVVLTAGKHMPWDRVWAVCHGASAFDTEQPEWVRSRNFVTQTFVPSLAQIEMQYDERSGALTLKHPNAEPITLNPETEGHRLCDWLEPLAGDMRPGPYRMARLPESGLTDFPDTHLAINSTRTLAVLEDASGQSLSPRRFRGNIWIDGLAPWEEFDWLDKEIQLGPVRIKVTDRILRCNATTANPATGRRDIDLPRLLEERWDHMDFGVYAQVIEGGTLRVGDPVSPAA
ncbi:MAG: MOSC domain-containing protein [Pseudomonadota bacterium]